ncbi:MAG: DUF4249 domain-containing protein [Chitinophagales bacterium]|jgi:hypothetical protein|nr:DUF4249 domain-containing protein [Chitinophagales bacterium]
MKQNNILFFVLGFLLSSLFLSCSERINLPLNPSDSKLVIEGEVTNLPGPYFVKLSQSVAYESSPIILPVTADSVIMSTSEGQRELLTSNQPGIYQTNSLIGKEGVTYELAVYHKGKQYLASSTMPNLVSIDSVYSYPDLFNPDLFNVAARILDPVNQTNYYRYFLSGNPKLQGNFYVLDDVLINGSKWNFSTNRDDLKRGDSVVFNLLSIDRPNFLIWRVLVENNINGTDNQLSPDNPKSNFSGDCLGYFSAHSISSRIVYIP